MSYFPIADSFQVLSIRAREMIQLIIYLKSLKLHPICSQTHDEQF